MLMIAVTILGSLVVAAQVNTTHAQLGIVKSYGPSIGSAQPYEPAGPYVDGVLVSQFLVNQNNEWQALKTGDIDVFDWAMTPSMVNEYNTNICVNAPDAPGGIAPCGANQAPIQHEISLQNVAELGKFEIDMQNQAFPTSNQAFRWAVAWVTDKENFTNNFLGGLGVPLYSALPCPAQCDPATGQWVDSSLLTPNAEANHVYGSGLPIATRIATANTILNNANFPIGTNGFRVDNGVGCAARIIPDPAGTGLITVNNCGKEIQPFMYVRLDDPNRLALGRFVHNLMQNSLHLDMDIGGTAKYTGDFQNYFELLRSGLRNAVFFQFHFNLYTGGWSLGRDPTTLDDLYDSLFIDPGDTNYVNFNDPVFNTAARALRAATTVANAVSAAHAAEIEYNASLPVIDGWSNNAPLAYRNYHVDPDSTLNGRAWSGFTLQKGTGWHTFFSWENLQLVGAPLHDPNHPVFVKWGWKTDILDSPNPTDSDFLWDAFVWSLSYDTINNLATDDLGFTGDLPWMASLPTVTNVASGALFPDGSTCTPDAPANGCEVLSYQLRSDLKFQNGLTVTASDVAFSILLGRDSPTSFIGPAYIHVQNVRVVDATHFQVEEKNQAIFDRHDIGATVVQSVQNWCVSAHNAWPGTSTPATTCAPPWPNGYPDAGANILTSNNGAMAPGNPVAVDFGSGPFTYDSVNSFTGGPSGPVLFRTAGYTQAGAPAYFASVPKYFSDSSVTGHWYKFHQAGNVNWYCTSCPNGPSETGPLPAPDMAINIVDLATIAAHFGQHPALGGSFGHAAWDLSGSAGTPDGTVDIFDLTRVSLHFGQSFLGGTDQGGGTEGSIPGWVSEAIPGT